MISRAMTAETAGQLRTLLADTDGNAPINALGTEFRGLTIHPHGAGYLITPPSEFVRERSIVSLLYLADWTVEEIHGRAEADKEATVCDTPEQHAAAIDRYQRRVLALSKARRIIAEAINA